MPYTRVLFPSRWGQAGPPRALSSRIGWRKRQFRIFNAHGSSWRLRAWRESESSPCEIFPRVLRYCDGTGKRIDPLDYTHARTHSLIRDFHGGSNRWSRTVGRIHAINTIVRAGLHGYVPMRKVIHPDSSPEWMYQPLSDEKIATSDSRLGSSSQRPSVPEEIGQIFVIFPTGFQFW